MLVNELIAELEGIKNAYGDIPIVGGYLNEDTPPRQCLVLDENGCEVEPGERAVGVFIE